MFITVSLCECDIVSIVYTTGVFRVVALLFMSYKDEDSYYFGYDYR